MLNAQIALFAVMVEYVHKGSYGSSEWFARGTYFRTNDLSKATYKAVQVKRTCGADVRVWVEEYDPKHKYPTIHANMAFGVEDELRLSFYETGKVGQVA